MTAQILEHLLADREQMMAKVKAEMKASYEEMTARLKAKMDSHHEKLMMIMKVSKEKIEAMRGPVWRARSQPQRKCRP
jgi:hypothetical protein